LRLKPPPFFLPLILLPAFLPLGAVMLHYQCAGLIGYVSYVVAIEPAAEGGDLGALITGHICICEGDHEEI